MKILITGVKERLKKIEFVHKNYLRLRESLMEFRDVLVWFLKIGHHPPPNPPKWIKLQAVKCYQKRFKSDFFIETGTYVGEMVDAVKTIFKEIYSIEIVEKLFNDAREKFSGFSHIHLFLGDSGEILKKLSSVLAEHKRYIFWLDAHYATYTGGETTPILRELEEIFRNMKLWDVILIDDARLFVGTGGYPKLEELKSLILSFDQSYKIEIKNDIIRILH